MARRGTSKLSPPARADARVVVARCVAAALVWLAVQAILFSGAFVVGLAVGPHVSGGVFGLVGVAVAEAGALAAVLAVWRYLDRKPLQQMGLERYGASAQWRRGAGVAALMMGSIVLAWYTLVDGAAFFLNPDLGRATLALVVGLLVFAIQGPSEEVLFRGYILENLRARWGARVAIGVSALAFAAIHVRNANFGVLPFINLLLFGVAAALYKLRVDGGQLWGVFAIHTVWNWLQQVVFGLPNSGLASSPENTLVTVQPNEHLPDVVWGGGFGPEGTLAASMVLTALIAFLLRKRERTS